MTTEGFNLSDQTAPIASTSRNSCAWVMLYVVGIGIIVALIGLAMILLVQNFEQNTDIAPDRIRTDMPPTATELVIINVTNTLTATNTLEASASPTAPIVVADANGVTTTFTFVPPTRLPDTATPTPTRTLTPTPTLTPSLTPTNTLTPSLTLTPSQTLTPSLTPSYSATPTATFTPTNTLTPSATPTSPFTPIAYPNGRRVEVYFDANSFYVWNPGPSAIRLSSIAFQGLDANGQPTGKSMSGELWAQFYFELESGKCVAIEITASSGWLQPSVCRDYNAIITPQRTSGSVFWLDDGNTVAFEASWAGEAVGQCALDAANCELFFP